MENVKQEPVAMPMLFPMTPDAFWEQLRTIIREELNQTEKNKKNLYEAPGLTYKPMYKIAEVCALFNITRPTMYEWIKHDKLKPHKVRGTVYFLWADIKELMGMDGHNTSQ